VSAQAAIAAAINAKFATPPVLSLARSRTATKDYINVFVARRYVEKRLASGEVSIPGQRVVVRCVCKDEENLSVFRARVAAALEDQILPGDIGPFVFESEDYVDPDLVDASGAWYLAESIWTF